MKKILISLAVIGIVGVVAIGGTIAYFSDTETSAGNTFTAGTLDLKVDGKDGSQVTTKYTLSNWKPGNNQMVGQVTLKNTGSLPGKYWVEIKNVVNNENGCNDPEIKAGDNCGATEGELGSKISGYFQENVSPWRHLNPSITSIDASQNIRMDGRILASNEQVPIVLYAKWLSTASDNKAQGDNVSFDLVFHLDQVTP
ncbi:MAG: TasA family protein [Candidatus Paceibacterota bacterium]